MSTQTAPPTIGMKILYITIAALLSVVIALIAGILISSTGAPLAEAVLYGGGAFIAVMTMSLTVLTVLGLP
ncbi:hypothetical protein RB625_33865 [Streptomyces californicus]|uniref:hypothetical protein n=1 Tax=Streptomyces californicus TaxID=67351 RepID=UPI00296F7FA3|nr:hypothetical protein [Streptomyces californicus]MDW4903396.1 hypothetical protein [Streptomyces californicus]